MNFFVFCFRSRPWLSWYHVVSESNRSTQKNNNNSFVCDCNTLSKADRGVVDDGWREAKKLREMNEWVINFSTNEVKLKFHHFNISFRCNSTPSTSSGEEISHCRRARTQWREAETVSTGNIIDLSRAMEREKNSINIRARSYFHSDEKKMCVLFSTHIARTKLINRNSELLMNRYVNEDERAVNFDSLQWMRTRCKTFIIMQ